MYSSSSSSSQLMALVSRWGQWRPFSTLLCLPSAAPLPAMDDHTSPWYHPPTFLVVCLYVGPYPPCPARLLLSVSCLAYNIYGQITVASSAVCIILRKTHNASGVTKSVAPGGKKLNGAPIPSPPPSSHPSSPLPSPLFPFPPFP